MLHSRNSRLGRLASESDSTFFINGRLHGGSGNLEPHLEAPAHAADR